MPGIRHVAICVFSHRGRILVGRGYDAVKRERFYRPLGGAVEFGELAVEALRREIREELELDIEDPIQLGVIENRFEYCGKPCHEVVFVFDARFTDPNVYAERELPINEPGWEGPAVWLDLRGPALEPLYPSGLGDLLRRTPEVVCPGLATN